MSANAQEITVIGNVTTDPELRFTSNGTAVANFTVAKNTSWYDANKNEWFENEALFFRCNVWRDQAENVAESIHKGDRVVVYGQLQNRSFETKQGEKRNVWEITVDELGPSLKWATANVKKAEFNSNPPEEETEKTTPKPKPTPSRRR